MTREQIDLEMLKFLREMEAKERAKDDGLRTAITNLTLQLQLLEGKIDASNAIHQERMAGFNARLTALEKDAEDTGVHNVSELRKKAEFWPGVLEKVAVGVVVALLSVGVTYAITKNAAASEAAAHAAEHAGHQ